ncbi:hypothetical protein ABRZ04_05235 [Castellaniella ginsengisoli]|uniref:Uncharacterized protein n=1 Tax=Castellaniella ginsengisoli TaxID=546114 RepID=A0AB39CSR6_9BURK
MWIKHKLMAPEGDGSSGGGGGGEAGGAETAPGTEVAQGQEQPGSVLGTGQNAPEATPSEFIPEKYHVKGADGELDVQASAQKLAEAYGHLSKKMGGDGAPPASADAYEIAVPDEIKGTLEEKGIDIKADPEIKDFLGRAHAAGMTQAQIDVVMGEYFKLAPQIANGSMILDQRAATDQLKEVWSTDADFNRNTHLAYTATAAAIERAGVSMEEVEAAGLGNNPVFLRLMAALGSEFQEDNAPGGTVHKSFGEDDITKLETSEAYSNPKHPDHDKVSKQVKAWYDRKYGTETVA